VVVGTQGRHAWCGLEDLHHTQRSVGVGIRTKEQADRGRMSDLARLFPDHDRPNVADLTRAFLADTGLGE